MRIIKDAEFIDAVNKALAGRGDDYVYPVRSGSYHGPSCTYGRIPNDDKSTSDQCLFGLAFTEHLGLPYDSTWECGSIGELLAHLHNDGTADFQISRALKGAAADTQAVQDNAATYRRVRETWEGHLAVIRGGKS